MGPDWPRNYEVPNGCEGASVAFFEDPQSCAASDLSRATLYEYRHEFDFSPYRNALMVRCCCRYPFDDYAPVRPTNLCGE